MSDNYTPFEIQMEIIKRLPVKSIIQFRSVSKAWKSRIDSSDFITHYTSQQQNILIKYRDSIDSKQKYISIVDDDTFPQQKVPLTVPSLVNTLESCGVIGSSRGLLCLHGSNGNNTAVVWNISIRKAIAVIVPNRAHGVYDTVLGFGVCRETGDPKIIKIRQISRWSEVESVNTIPWQVEFFALRTRVWKSLNGDLPRKTIRFGHMNVVIDGCLYWLAIDRISMDGGYRYSNLIMSFDVTSEEFKEVRLPDSLAHGSYYHLSMTKLKESLVVFEYNGVENNLAFVVWMMEDGGSGSFAKLFSVSDDIYGVPLASVRGFRKRGEPITGIVELEDLARGGAYPYVESLLLLDQPDLMVYNDV